MPVTTGVITPVVKSTVPTNPATPASSGAETKAVPFLKVPVTE